MARSRSRDAVRDADPVSRASGRAWHARSVDELSAALQLDIARGLTTAEAAARLARDGANALPEGGRRSVLVMFLHQFKSLIVVLLLVAAVVALVMGDVMEAVAILAVIALNAVIGLVTEWKAASAIESLRRRVVTFAQVRRDGTEHQVRAETLVVGDVVMVAAGDRVPADGRVVEQVRLQVDESALTGESLPVAKSTDAVADDRAPLGDRSSMVHMGTAVTDGRGVLVVTATGAATEMGAIGTMLEDLSAKRTPLEGKLQQLSRALLVVVLVLCVVIVVMGWLRGHPLLPMVEVGISLAIAAVPEGLLAVTTMTLAVGMQRMAHMHALIRRLPAVESLGSTTVICTDKTGTLTRNEMTVRVIVAAGRRVNVTGIGYASDGHLEVVGAEAATEAPDESVRLALRIGALCNDASLNVSGGQPVVLGDPTEAALIVAAAKAGMDHATLEREYPRLREIPFESRSKRMVTVHRTPDGRVIAYAKGAPSALLDASGSVVDATGVVTMTPASRQRILATNDALAGEALRVLAFAYRELPAEYGDDDLTRDLTFVGVVGMMDPLREEARATIERCRIAGIRAVMITGDQQVTASAIARQLGLDVSADGRPMRTMHERDLATLDADGWRDAVTGTAVFARVSPHHKLQIVEALQRQGEVVAMTGDGVNDAPALRKADVGVAMGIRGTEVAKESADMIITDDNFATIVRAVEQGRVIVENILRFIHYLFSCNFAEILTVFVAIMIGWPLPIGVLQILWLNLVTDIFPAMALALEPSAPDVMQRPPRDPSAPLMTPRFGWLIVWQGSVLAGCSLSAFGVGLRWYGTEGEGLRHAMTIAFMALALAQVAHVFSARSITRSAIATGVKANRWLWGATLTCLVLQLATIGVPLLQRVLRTTPLTLVDWGVVLVAALTPVVVVEAVKLAKRGRQPTRA